MKDVVNTDFITQYFLSYLIVPYLKKNSLKPFGTFLTLFNLVIIKNKNKETKYLTTVAILHFIMVDHKIISN